MTYFADLSIESYLGRSLRPSRTVGWLDEHHAFPSGVPDPQFLEALWNRSLIMVNPTRGFHLCAFCEVAPRLFSRNGVAIQLGSAEIRVFDACGDAFAAPDLLYHYVADHHYRPPPEFVTAVMSGPATGSDAYFKLLEECERTWRHNPPIDAEPRVFRFVRMGNEVRREVLEAGVWRADES